MVFLTSRSGMADVVAGLDAGSHDYLRNVNDTYGHPAGDQVLQDFARRLTGEVRLEDIAGRWGGEEFLVILPGADPRSAGIVAERIRLAIARAPVVVDGAQIRCRPEPDDRRVPVAGQPVSRVAGVLWTPATVVLPCGQAGWLAQTSKLPAPE